MPGKSITSVGRYGGIRYNDFHTDLRYSLDNRDDETLNDFYRKAFPFAVEIEFCQDLSLQKKGIDKLIHLSNGNTLTIDEKKRRRDYGDILLELWSNKERNTPGWLQYSQCDYIVYAILPAKKVYLLPTLLLQMAWKNNKREWLTAYPKTLANNGYYNTENIAIPADVLLHAISAEMQKQIA